MIGNDLERQTGGAKIVVEPPEARESKVEKETPYAECRGANGRVQKRTMFGSDQLLSIAVYRVEWRRGSCSGYEYPGKSVHRAKQ